MSKDKLLLMLRNDDTNANDDQRTICVEEAGSCDRLQLNKLQVRDWQDNVNLVHDWQIPRLLIACHTCTLRICQVDR